MKSLNIAMKSAGRQVSMSDNSVVARAYNTFRVEPFGLIRKSSQTARLADEIGYYKIIQRDINKSIFFPRLIASHVGSEDSILAGDENWLLMEQYDYQNLGQFLTGRCDHPIDWSRAFDSLTQVMSQFETFADTQPGDVNYTRAMYITKTETEYQNLVDTRPDLDTLFDATHVSVNGESLANFNTIWPSVKSYIETHMLEYTSGMIHGDMCFSNILYGPNIGVIKFIDPRGSFGKRGIFGDVRYDVAKLYHSLDGGYEFIINDMFSVDCEDDGWNTHIHYSVYRPQALLEFEKRFFDTGAFSKKEIKIIQGCIYIGMCARHYDSIARQEIMYLTGIRLLNEAMNL